MAIDPCSCPKIVESRSTSENVDLAFLIWEVVKIFFAIAWFFFQYLRGRNGNRRNRRNRAFLRRIEAQELEEIGILDWLNVRVKKELGIYHAAVFIFMPHVLNTFSSVNQISFFLFIFLKYDSATIG